MKLGTAQVIRGNALDLPLADNTVDLIVTSPPYFGLRSYQDGGEHYAGQIGDEATPAEFVDALIGATREMVRVLKPSGSIFVNLGDKYAGGGGGGAGSSDGTTGRGPRPPRFNVGIPAKSLIGIPWRYALRCIDDLGLILRAEIIWSKPNGLPESVTDRVRRSHEQWFYFEQSGGIESAPETFPFCSLCGRPVDARSTLIRRLKESESGAESVGVTDHVREDVRSDSPDARRGGDDVAVGTLVPPVPSLGERDIHVSEDAPQLGEDRVVAAVDGDAENGAALSADERHRSFAVNESGEPSGVCECEGHALTLNDEPWIPQRLAADLMQMVADGEADPQSVSDFLSGDYARTHSTWFHFTREPRYFSAVDEVRETHVYAIGDRRNGPGAIPRDNAGRPGADGSRHLDGNPLGKLPGSVRTVPTEPLRVPDHLGVDHFAAFPTAWPKWIIQGWAPTRGVCVECGGGRRPVAATERRILTGSFGIYAEAHGADGRTGRRAETTATITGYACACHEPTAPTRPAVILDPFGGTGTTALVAKALGCHGISVDMSADYCRLAEWRTNDPSQLAKVLDVEKPPEVAKNQTDLFDLLGGDAA